MKAEEARIIARKARMAKTVNEVQSILAQIREAVEKGETHIKVSDNIHKYVADILTDKDYGYVIEVEYEYPPRAYVRWD